MKTNTQYTHRSPADRWRWPRSAGWRIAGSWGWRSSMKLISNWLLWWNSPLSGIITLSPEERMMSGKWKRLWQHIAEPGWESKAESLLLYPTHSPKEKSCIMKKKKVGMDWKKSGNWATLLYLSKQPSGMAPELSRLLPRHEERVWYKGTSRMLQLSSSGSCWVSTVLGVFRQLSF